jgi:5'-nucleotidase / UDP-sugar diphosphatase
MKRYLVVLMLLAACGLSWSESVSLFFTNDTHGAYLPNSYKTAEGNIELGGYENLYNLITTQRDTLEHTLWLDAGDQQTGSVFSSLVYKNALGGAVVEAFNKMGLDAATFGNHEFDQSFANTKRLVKLAKYPFLSANLVYKNTGKPFTGQPYKIFQRGKLRIGVLGLTLTELEEKVKIGNTARLNILPYKQAIDQYIDLLDQKTDLIILLTHNGIEADSLLATQLDSRIDLIVGGHTHAVTEKPLLVNGIYIVQTGAFIAYYGRLDLDIQYDKIANNLTNTDCLYLVVQTPSAKPSKLSKFVDKMSGKINKNMNQVLGYTDVDWIPDKFRETAASQWQAEALYREYYFKYKPDIALINCGGLRKAIPAGPITMKDMTEMLPFTNYITIFSCYGRDLQPFIEHNLALMQSQEHDIVQAYNLTWQILAGQDTIKVREVRISGEPVIPDKLYKIVSHDYLAGQAAKYLLFEPVNPEYTSDLILDVMVRQVEKQLGKKKI